MRYYLTVRLPICPGLVLLLGLIALEQLGATPPTDPICAPASSSYERVQTARFEILANSPRKEYRLQQAAAPPALSIDLSAAGAPRLTLAGLPGQSYQLEATSDPADVPWTPWLSVVATREPLVWSDNSMHSAVRQFFRAREAGPDLLSEFVSNFRLIDQAGTARDLYYHTHLDAIAVVAAGEHLERVSPMLPILKELSSLHTNKLAIWILLSDPLAVRSNVLAQTKDLKIDFPVLLDPFGLATRSVGLQRAGEVVLVQPPAFVSVYRGEIAAPLQITGASSYLGQALASLSRKEPLQFIRTPVDGPLLPTASRATADYSREVAPILYKHCAICHHPEGVAPFALTSYDVVQQRAPSIKHALLSNKMPPWHADGEYGRYANDLSLPGDLRSTLVQWIDAGAPRGAGPDPLAELPRPAAFDQLPSDLGEPDALVTIPVQQIKAKGSEPYRYIFVRAPNPTNVWLKAALIRPSNYQAVHHYLVWPGQIGNFGTPDNSTYQAHIAEFVPGYQPLRMPADSGIFLGKSNWLTFNLHYTPYGVATNDQPVLALWYHKTKPPKSWAVNGLANVFFSIPPGARDFEVQAELTIPKAITVQRFNPHMHLRGKRMKYEVVYPNRTRETLCSVPDFDFNWQIGFQLAEPKTLPAGSRIIASGAFDNSPQNLANPDPTAQVGWGDQSWMEMFVGYIDYTE